MTNDPENRTPAEKRKIRGRISKWYWISISASVLVVFLWLSHLYLGYWLYQMEESDFGRKPAKFLLHKLPLWLVGKGLMRTPDRYTYGIISSRGEAGVPYLVKAYKSTDRWDRQLAVENLQWTGFTEEGMEILIVALKDRDPEVRAEAVKSLGYYSKDAKDALPALAELLIDKDEFIRYVARNAIYSIGLDSETELQYILDQLKTKNVNIIKDVRSLFRNFPSSNTIVLSKLTSIARDQNSPIRNEVIMSLGGFKDPTDELLTLMSELLEEDNAGVRISAAKGIAGFREAAAKLIPQLIQRTKDNDPWVKASSLKALASVGKNSAVVEKAIIQTSKDESSLVRETCILVLSRMQDISPEGAQCIIEGLGDKDEKVRTSAAVSLKNIPKGNKQVAKFNVSSLDSNELGVLHGAVKAIPQHKPSPQLVIPKLILILESGKGSADLKTDTIKALGFYKAKAVAAIPVLAKIIKNDQDVIVRKTAVATFCSVGNRRHLPLLDDIQKSITEPQVLREINLYKSFLEY